MRYRIIVGILNRIFGTDFPGHLVFEVEIYRVRDIYRKNELNVGHYFTSPSGPK